jgi:RimJ/RimL family protein N-acetyltransferase
MEPVGGPIDLTEEQARDWFHEMVDPGSPAHCYLLICDAQGHPVGEVSYHRLNLATMTAEFNIKIASHFRGKGYAKASMRQFLQFFFGDVGGRVLVDPVATDNLAGQELLKSFHFKLESKSPDACTYVLTLEDYTNLHRQDPIGASG